MLMYIIIVTSEVMLHASTAVMRSVVLVWLHIVRFSLVKRLLKNKSLVSVLVSQLKWKKGY